MALGRTPILAARERRARGPVLVALWSAYLYVAMLAVILGEGAFGVGQGLLAALAAGGTVLLVHTAVWAWRASRARWPAGRFLFTWGYVEVEHDRLRYVAASELAHEVIDDGLGRSIVALRASGFASSFVVARDAVPREALARLGQPSPPPVLDGYRDAPWVIEGPPAPRFRPSRRARLIASVGLAAILGAALAPYAGVLVDAIAPPARQPLGDAGDPSARSTQAPARLHARAR